jgi:hypothetical protein
MADNDNVAATAGGKSDAPTTTHKRVRDSTKKDVKQTDHITRFLMDKTAHRLFCCSHCYKIQDVRPVICALCLEGVCPKCSEKDSWDALTPFALDKQLLSDYADIIEDIDSLEWKHRPDPSALYCKTCVRMLNNDLEDDLCKLEQEAEKGEECNDDVVGDDDDSDGGDDNDEEEDSDERPSKKRRVA